MSRLIHRGRLISLYEEQAALPDGREVALDIVRHPGGAVVACVNDEREVCLIRQLRHATSGQDSDGWIWELPAGVLEPGEPSLTTAKRELAEETGVIAKQWRALGAIWSTPGFTNERLHLFFCRADSIGQPEPEADECIEVHWLALDAAVEMALTNQIDDAKTVVGLLRAQACLRDLVACSEARPETGPETGPEG